MRLFTFLAVSGVLFAQNPVVITQGGRQATVTGANALKTDGSAVTQPISAAALPLPTGAAADSTLTTISGQLPPALVSGRLSVDGSGVTQPVSGTVGISGTVPVSGTFWQATQPVSAVSLPLPTGASTLAEQQTQTTALQLLDDTVAATADTAPAKAILAGVTAKSTQPTAVTDGQLTSPLASLDGAVYMREGGPIIWSCSLGAIGTTLTECQAAPGAGLKLYITDILTQSSTTTSGLWTLRYGTGANCGTGTGNVFGTATARFAGAANTLVTPVRSFRTPLVIPANNAVCVLGVATNTVNITLNGYTAP